MNLIKNTVIKDKRKLFHTTAEVQLSPSHVKLIKIDFEYTEIGNWKTL